MPKHGNIEKYYCLLLQLMPKMIGIDISVYNI